MCRELRVEMRNKSRRLKGLLNLLTDDIYRINSDSEDFDLICLEESINDAKETLQMFVDGVTELEYVLYLSKNDRSSMK